MAFLLTACANASRTLELLHLVIERDVAGGVRRTQEELEARVAPDHQDVLRIQPLHAVDLTRLQRAQALRVVLDVPHDHALHPGLRAPGVGIGLEDDLLVRLPLDKLKRARAHRVLPELRAPLLHRARARDVEDEHGEVREERRLRVLERDADRVRADGFDPRDDRLVVEPAELRLPVLEGLARLDLVVVLRVVGFPPALEVPDDGRGVERAPVVELDPAAKLEGPDPAVPRHVPPLGQRRLDLGGRPLVPHEPVEDLPGDARRDPVSDDCWIQLHGLTLGAEHEGLAERGAHRELQDDGDEEREHCVPHRTRPPLASEAWGNDSPRCAIIVRPLGLSNPISPPGVGRAATPAR